MSELPRYPEHEKLSQIQPMSQQLGEFLDYGGYTLCFWDDRLRQFIPARGSIESILADYFHIDLKKLNAEKDDMLDRVHASWEQVLAERDHD